MLWIFTSKTDKVRKGAFNTHTLLFLRNQHLSYENCSNNLRYAWNRIKCFKIFIRTIHVCVCKGVGGGGLGEISTSETTLGETTRGETVQGRNVLRAKLWGAKRFVSRHTSFPVTPLGISTQFKLTYYKLDRLQLSSIHLYLLEI